MPIEIETHPNDYLPGLLYHASECGLCLLDSCGKEHEDSEWSFAGVFPCETLELSGDLNQTLEAFDSILTGDKPAIFTVSYDLGNRLLNPNGRTHNSPTSEPDLFVSTFESLIAHNYRSGRTVIAGDSPAAARARELLMSENLCPDNVSRTQSHSLKSNLTKQQYLERIDIIKEHIRCGDTYQTNLTQQFKVEMPADFNAATTFCRMRHDNPAPFTAYLERPNSTVISCSPERFFRVKGRRIEASPIKGTRPRGISSFRDLSLRNELLASEKDRAENVMIVDLMRNDLGRICEFGSVHVRDLCRLQTLPSIFHLVSTIEGTLCRDVRPSDVIKALFPCGSITGAPKIRTARIIEELEPDPRGLSMGAIGIYIPPGLGLPPVLDLSVAIRTMVIRDGYATFNVGGGIVIDSDPDAEYEESLIKAAPLFRALGVSEPLIHSNQTSREHFDAAAV
jgi:aminodeoxychorismate synthase component I